MRKAGWVLLLCLGLPLAGGAEPQPLRMAVPFPPGSKGMADLQQAARVLFRQTGGRVQIKFTEQLDLETGDCPADGGFLAGSPLALRSPTAAMDSLPLRYRTVEEAARFREQMAPLMAAELEARGYVPLAFVDLGFAYLLSVQPLETVEAFQASRLWVPAEDPRAWELSAAYGTARISLAASQVRGGLQDGSVEAVVAPPLGAILLQWHVELRSVSDRPFLHLLGAGVLKREALEKMEAEDRALVCASLAAAFEAVAGDLRQKEAESLEVLVQNGAGRHPFGITPEQEAGWVAWASRVAEHLSGAGVVSGTEPGADRE